MQIILDRFGIDIDYTRELLIVALIFARTMPMIYLTPFLGGQVAPSEIKIGLGIVLTIILWPLAHGSLSGDIPYQVIPFVLLMTKEIFVGFAIGYVNSHIFWAVEMAGRIIDTVRGTAMSEVLDPHSKSRATPIGIMYMQLLVAFFLLIGGHRVFISTYCYSFAAIPLDKGILLGNSFAPYVDFAIHMTAQVLLIATMLAAPAIAATFITDLVFGILNRVAPQLNAYFMSMPVKAMAGIFMVFLAFTPFIDRLEGYVLWTLDAVQQTISLLSGQKIIP